jgi:hypothetical protein
MHPKPLTPEQVEGIKKHEAERQSIIKKVLEKPIKKKKK